MFNFLHIKNFRIYKDFKIDNLARVNLIVGKNNVGKSSFLEAINILSNSQPIQSMLALLDSRDELIPNGDQSNHESGYEFVRLFNNANRDEDIILDNDNNKFVIHWQYDIGDEYAAHESGFIISDAHDVFRPQIFMPSSGTFVNADQSKQSSMTIESRSPCIFTTYSNLEYPQLVSAWDDIQLTPLEPNVVEFLQIIEPTIERVANQQSNGRFMIKSKDFSSPVPMKSFGNGISAVFGIGLGLAQAENGYLLIDEIDTGLHYRELTTIWKAIMETAVRLNIQVFATTHSYDCMRSFAEALSLLEDDSAGALFRLQRRGENIESVRVDAEDIIYAIEQDIEMR